MNLDEIKAAGVSDGRAFAIGDALASARVEVPEEVRGPVYWFLGLATYATRLTEVNLPGLVTVAATGTTEPSHVLSLVKAVVDAAPDVFPNAPSRAAVLELIKLVLHVADASPLPRPATRPRHSTEV